MLKIIFRSHRRSRQSVPQPLPPPRQSEPPPSKAATVAAKNERTKKRTRKQQFGIVWNLLGAAIELSSMLAKAGWGRRGGDKDDKDDDMKDAYPAFF